MDNLTYMDKRATTYQKQRPEQTLGFQYYVVTNGSFVSYEQTKFNHILFVLEGEIVINCNEFSNKVIKANQCILIPKLARISGEVEEKGKFLMLTFDTLRSVCDRQYIEAYRQFYGKYSYNFEPTAIRFPMDTFLEQMVQYLQNGLNCEQLHLIKERELFLLLRNYYGKEEMINLLYPMLGESNFKSLILDNYLKVESVAELVKMSGMCRTAFDYKFKEIFNISPRQWMLKQIAQQVLYKAMDPKITIADLMGIFKFNSATHFNRFCRQQFNCTPGELIKRQRALNDHQHSELGMIG